MGAADEQHPPLRRGKRTERPDLRLTEIDTPFSTPADYGQVSLFRTPEEQIEQIADSAEAPAPALFAARLTDSITDRILAAGGNEGNRSLRIYARYQAADSAGNIAAFLKKEYGVGGRGFTVDGAPFSLWFDETGICIAPETLRDLRRLRCILLGSRRSSVSASWWSVAHTCPPIKCLGHEAMSIRNSRKTCGT